MKTSTRCQSTVRKVTSATAQIQHIVLRVRSASNDARYRAVDAVTPAEKALRKARNAKGDRIGAFTDKYIDGLVLSGAPCLTSTLRDFKAKLAAIK